MYGYVIVTLSDRGVQILVFTIGEGLVGQCVTFIIGGFASKTFKRTSILSNFERISYNNSIVCFEVMLPQFGEYITIFSSVRYPFRTIPRLLASSTELHRIIIAALSPTISDGLRCT